ncbi:dipeptide transport system permease protein DppB [Oceanobacillus picturae]|jgi:peptide/nickel transport system permease protein|uniref:Dipeptide transport system permease protein DppB n=2 Tax=Oceanobacillus TaxID=182709 RepID=W9AIT8_9BACI|nr:MULTISPECIES: ABC transporter permease [Oceanobacillus]AVQ98749.1 ABC transporter permease [Oceanobacillus iheyensis]NAO99948.1 ABC transporter permease subunit [Halomonas sp. MG34]MCG3420915.1 ABC transporter permease [Oceanobacillus jordanicus]RIU90063.1 ABC transporter permease [Oceanobacillus picturae]CDO02556.1 Dipeptide transport system permease protein DppB [Oceanobacillus picturae]
MKKYLVKRLLQIIPVLFIISFVVFVLVYMAGDPVALMLPEDASESDREAMRAALGLTDPFYIQYFRFVGDLIQGNFGTSFRYNQAALPLVLERLPATFELAAASMVVATLMAIPLGIYSARKQNSLVDLFITGGSVLGKAMPNFWLGILLILLFAVNIQFFPVSGRGTIVHMILPAITLGTGIAAEMTRLIRSNMLEILNQDYIRTARSKGVSSNILVYKHAFRNSLIPVVTIMGLQVSHLVSGALITESVFSWPGIGLLLVQAVNGRDMAVVQAAVFVIALLVIIVNLITDLIYRLLDPRINYS